jgi:hypothetical protein
MLQCTNQKFGIDMTMSILHTGVCKIQTIVALYQLHGRIGRNDVGIDTKQQKVCIAEECIRYGEFVNWLNELVLFLCMELLKYEK